MTEPRLQPPVILTVFELTKLISEVIEKNFDYIWVEGEVSNLRVPSSGHHYFTLKDEESQIRAVLFRGHRKMIPFEIEDGQKLICLGRLGVYARRGEYQIIVEYVEPSGIGSLHLAFEQLKEKLGKEGLFDEERKRPIPPHPKRIGVVTSPTGAAIRDILNILERRNAGVEVFIAPAMVQGETAASEVARGIEILNGFDDIDVIIVGRGGGSIEDLWVFNEEMVARAIRDSRIPVVSAVGHERDFTISDFAADLRAPTPSAAAEMVARSTIEISREIDRLKERLCFAVASRLASLRGRLDQEIRAIEDPGKRIGEMKIRADDLLWRIERRAADKIGLLRSDLRGAAGKLESLSPLAVLARGYSITKSLPEGEVIRDKDQVAVGKMVGVRLQRGELVCRVEEKPE